MEDPGSAEGETWTKLELRLRGIMSELSTATTLDDMQDVGRRCREVLIDAGKLLADPSLVPEGGVTPQAANAKGWLDLFLSVHAVGRTHRELRAFVPVCWDLAQKVTHGDVDRVDVYAAAQATVLVGTADIPIAASVLSAFGGSVNITVESRARSGLR